MMHRIADRCPACGTERNAPPVTPYKAREFHGCIVARYSCPDCQVRWLVCWDVASLAGAA